ncbi:Hypothetical protein CINCED_3A011472 [Cinara cedri]|uniref:Uncharacterized protein n=1 Tax=Cinara cedri TaxID=506608 RepID=A0A5E4M1X6_9HEMI|nr:Hypothetical protein CINCED_3A011472 [Cinara cedri]
MKAVKMFTMKNELADHLWPAHSKCDETKSFMGGQNFNEDDEVKKAISAWLQSQASSFYDEGIQKLVPRYDKCLNNGGNYVEK